MNPKFCRSSLHALSIAVVMISVTYLLSCAPTAPGTSITGSWKDPASGSYNDFFVIVMAKNPETRRTLESDLFFRLKKEGVKAELSMEVLPQASKPTTPEERNAVVEKIQSLGHEAVIAISLKKKTEESRYIPGGAQYAPTNVGYGTGYNNQLYQSAAGPVSYTTFGGYYNYNYSIATSDGYYDTLKTYFVESNVFDSKTAKLVWSAQSETFNPVNLTSASSGFSLEVVKAMKASGILAGKKKK